MSLSLPSYGPCGVRVDNDRGPCGVRRNNDRGPCGVRKDNDRGPCGVSFSAIIVLKTVLRMLHSVDNFECLLWKS